MRKRFWAFWLVTAFLGTTLNSLPAHAGFFDKQDREERVKQENETVTKNFEWWPTDAKPGAVKDPERGGYWWMPREPGEKRPWGNRGYIYVYKIIFDYKEEELPPPQPEELRPSLLIRKIVKNVKVYFDYDKADLRPDATALLEEALSALKKSEELDILVTGNADIRGSEQYNEKLARRRGEVVKDFMIQNGIPEDRIRVVSRGKLDAIARVTDLVGMQKDRNAQFMLAVVEEVMIPYKGEGPAPAPEAAQAMGEGKFLTEEEEKVESDVQVSTREYVVQKGDTLSAIAQREMGAAHRWKYLYEINKQRIANPDRLRPGQKIVIPIE